VKNTLFFFADIPKFDFFSQEIFKYRVQLMAVFTLCKGRDHLTMVILTILTINLQINMKELQNRKKCYRYVLLFIN
jgi:hypothetical protein